MDKQIKVLIAEENEEIRGFYSKILTENNYVVSWSPKHGVRVLQAICENVPDAVVVDAFMPCLDSAALIKQIDELGVEKKPKVLVILPFENEDLRGTNYQVGAAGFLTKPFIPSALMDELKRIFNSATPEAQFVNFPQKSQKTNFLEIKVTEILHQIGVPAHIKGYHYLRESIIMAIEMPDIINAVTRKLYPSVARAFDTTSSRVERAIRHAIEVAWDRGDIEVLNSYFGYTIHNARGKPTNSEFVAMISDKLRLQIKNAS